jgi:hypothetical protein
LNIEKIFTIFRKKSIDLCSLAIRAFIVSIIKKSGITF